MDNLKILHISESDFDGGGSIAQYRLHKGLLASGVDSRMLVLKKLSSDDTVIKLRAPFLDFRRNLNLKINSKIVKLFSLSNTHKIKFPGLGNGIVSTQYYDNVDIVNMGWVERGVITVKDIAKIPCPIVWTTHLLWPISDGAQYYYGDGEEAYKRDEIPRNPTYFFEKLLRKYRRRYWQNRMDWVACQSNWVERLALTSPHFDRSHVRNIGLYLDTDIWKPGDQQLAKEMLGLSLGDRIVSFGANNIDANTTKGADMAMQLIARAQTKGLNYKFLCFGAKKLSKQLDELNIVQFGKMSNDQMRLIYQASDCFINFSKIETFCLVVQEAMACGAPCVAFPVGAIPEMISHKVSGYLAKPFSVEDCLEGLQWVMNDSCRHKELRQKAREEIVSKYGKSETLDKYIQLYKEAKNSWHGLNYSK